MIDSVSAAGRVGLRLRIVAQSEGLLERIEGLVLPVVIALVLVGLIAAWAWKDSERSMSRRCLLGQHDRCPEEGPKRGLTQGCACPCHQRDEDPLVR